MMSSGLRLLAAAAIAVGLSMAQGPGFGPQAGQPLADPQQGWDRMLERWSVVLNLTESQKEQVKAIFSAAVQEREALEPQLVQARDALREAARTNAPPAVIDNLAAELGGVLGRLHASQAKACAHAGSILTSAQREQFDRFPCAGLGMYGYGWAQTGRMGGGFGRGPRR